MVVFTLLPKEQVDNEDNLVSLPKQSDARVSTDVTAQGFEPKADDLD